jgi:hypothetical protein
MLTIYILYNIVLISFILDSLVKHDCENLFRDLFTIFYALISGKKKLSN